MEKYETNLNALAMKLLSSKKAVQFNIGEDLYSFKYSPSPNMVQVWRNCSLIFSRMIVASVVAPHHIKDCLERCIYLLDYTELKDAYGIYEEPKSLVKDKAYQAMKGN